MCGAKQSLIKEYIRGSGRECRLMVQQLSVSSQKMDQSERDVAELVLTGKMEPPLIENSIREESERLVANRNQAPDMKKDNSFSKWESFCSKTDDEKCDDNMQVKVQERSLCNWVRGEKNILRVDDKKTENSAPSEPRNAFESSGSTSRLKPLADFHRMSQQDKKHFKWQPKTKFDTNPKSIPSEVRVSCTNINNDEPLVTSKPKPHSFLKEQSSIEPNINGASAKRQSCVKEFHVTQIPLMSFAKKSKWSDSGSSESQETMQSNIEASGSLSQQQIPPDSASKWSKFISHTMQETEEYD
ncbi:uncharacterized protein LOC134225746 isoform X2 [Armigeres subalbatus]